MVLYHASLKPLDIEDIVSVDNFDGETTHYYQQLCPTEKDVEEKLDQYRPPHYCSRKKTIFLFDEPIYCFYFARKQYKNQRIYVYEVDTEKADGGFPMCLVHQIYKKLCSGKDCINITSEYWRPQREWYVKEYLATSIIIKRECENPNNDIGAAMCYDIDVQQAEKLK